ncbi:MAG TPA: tRNA pseudouridine synthase A [Thermoguttaceae bacterium]|nr:tRNA pseudouridine synthase A [Thermoguttaceae bacterium]
MPTFKITLAYDGSCFTGWQLQPGQRTVQGVLEVVLRQLTGQSVRVRGASRTDTGVHALGQVAAFTLDARFTAEELLRAMNALLPADVAILQIEEASAGFRPSRDAAAKRYRYLIYDGPIRHIFLRRYAWQMDYRLDAWAMHQAGQRLVGTHDFASFQSRGSPRLDTIRTLFDVSVRRCGAGQRGSPRWTPLQDPVLLCSLGCPVPSVETSGRASVPEQKSLDFGDFVVPQGRAGQGGDLVVVEVEGNGFLYHMVRAIVGTLVEVGRGKRPPEWLAEVLAARNRSAAGKTAPPEGLYLLYVRFDPPSGFSPERSQSWQSEK